MTYTCFTFEVADHVAHLQLCRPAELNTMNEAFWRELPQAFDAIEQDPGIRAVVISSTGRHFTAGLDLNWAGGMEGERHPDPGRAREKLRRHIRRMQIPFTKVDQCRVPVIAAIHGGCVGGGVDLVTACDIRVGSADCFFTIQEVNVAIVADVGTLQRIPYLLPQGLVRELAYTGRRWPAEEALRFGFLNRVFPTRDDTIAGALALAREIAAKSPLVVAGIKQMLNAGRDLTIEQGLEYVATWNAAMLPGEDMRRAIAAQMRKEEAQFDDLAA
ncbi:MAG: crotonase/enoyl-CoA hydratase family protein [Sphingomonadaceae bacterium]|uniref:crotonase/enoyl-CoA hydratase family protein n=1 Tax=Thermaurantiacus sp. TaxID=2820283 RepID=UPI00298F1529|nr:crotonase/enoyl-CoA hydratase family protein [Thermaurantiacus sp.]MCS6987844.1 crotonase/enoyl-CoA hydratase family protein [Sphingomonadaceae bacterium]MDW8414936.1 crotonase/enoyl-CoA hydratase family protein [Thermaurantiacus sp.]